MSAQCSRFSFINRRRLGQGTSLRPKIFSSRDSHPFSLWNLCMYLRRRRRAMYSTPALPHPQYDFLHFFGQPCESHPFAGENRRKSSKVSLKNPICGRELWPQKFCPRTRKSLVFALKSPLLRTTLGVCLLPTKLYVIGTTRNRAFFSASLRHCGRRSSEPTPV